MTTRINFKNFKKGDNVTITIVEKNQEEVISGTITKISQTKKILCFENDTSDFECKFSEIKKIILNDVSESEFVNVNNNVNADRGVDHVFKKIFDQSTRVNRGEYWGYVVLTTILYAVVLAVLLFYLKEQERKEYITETETMIWVGVSFLFLVYIPHKIILAKRVQDTNTSSGIVGWSVVFEVGTLIAWKFHAIPWLIMSGILSLINFILFILSVIPGTNGPNRYGEPTMKTMESGATTKINSLEKLFALKEKGILTEAEFNQEKRKLLSKDT